MIEKQHAVVGQAQFPGPGQGSATHQGGSGAAVVGTAEGALPPQAGPLPQQPGQGMQLGDLQGLLVPQGPGLPQLALLGVLHSLIVTSLTATSLAVLPPGRSGLGAGLALGGTGLAASLVRLGFGAAGPVGSGRLLVLLAASTGTALVGCLLLAGGRRRQGVA